MMLVDSEMKLLLLWWSCVSLFELTCRYKHVQFTPDGTASSCNDVVDDTPNLSTIYHLVPLANCGDSDMGIFSILWGFGKYW